MRCVTVAATRTPRPRMSAAQRREQLLDVTKEIVGEQGFHAVSIEAVARRAGISRPIVYSHFGDLSGLLEAMLERESERALSQLAAILPPAPATGDITPALLAALRGYLDAVEADPVTWRLVLIPPEGAPELLRDRVESGREAVVSVLAELVGTGIAPGRSVPDPKLTARLLSAVADEAARLMLTDPGEYPIERLMAHASWMLEELRG
jgi:AcrR family transcriptional regulator